MSKKYFLRIILLAIMLSTLIGTGVFAQDKVDNFSNKDIILIVPFGSGGGTDLMARALSSVSNDYLPVRLKVLTMPGGEPHIHVTVKDVNGDRVYVGHLEAGSRCCYRIEMGLLILKDIRTKRVTNPETGLIDIEMEE